MCSLRVQELLISAQLFLLLTASQASIVLEEMKPGRGVITLSLENLDNPHGVLSEWGTKCDQRTACDPYFIVTVGTDVRGSDLLSSQTGVWRNQDSLRFVFFNQSLAINGSLPALFHLHIVVMDHHMSGDQLIAEFDHEVQLNEPDRPTKVKLFSTPKNKFVSLTVQVEVTCAEFYYGPMCSEFCRAAQNVTTCRPDGSLACLDGTIDCMRQVKEEKSVSETATAERVEVPRTLVYWVIPGVCFGLLITVLMGLLVRLARSRSEKIIVTTQDASLEVGGSDYTDPQQQAFVYEQRQLPDNIDILRSPTLLLAPADNQRFRNPVYSAFRGGGANSPARSAGARSFSVTTQSSVVTSVAATEDAAAPAVSNNELGDVGQDDDDVMTASMDSSDHYEEIDEVLREGEDEVQQPVSPNEAGRPLPPPGMF